MDASPFLLSAPRAAVADRWGQDTTMTPQAHGRSWQSTSYVLLVHATAYEFMGLTNPMTFWRMLTTVQVEGWQWK